MKNMYSLYILNGPNLNLTGTRDNVIYGTETLQQIEEHCQGQAKKLGYSVDFRQTNHEGILIDWVQEARTSASGLIINGGGLTHTSISLMDALKALTIPVVEVHLSQIFAREQFRHWSYVAQAAQGVIAGFGANGYTIAMEAIGSLITQREQQR